MLRRRLPQRFGGQTVYVSPGAQLGYWRWDLARVDRLLFQLVTEFVSTDSVVWDVGANVGLFALCSSYLAGATGRVMAVEADGWLADLLCRSVAAAPPGRAPVSVVVAAVSSSVGTAEFAIAARGRSSNSLGAASGLSQTGGVRYSFHAVTVTLDWLLERFRAPTVVKIDVEGAVDACLAGATRVLSDVRPDVLCEVPECSDGTAARILRTHDYVLFNAALPPEHRVALERPVWSTLARPRERSGSA